MGSTQSKSFPCPIVCEFIKTPPIKFSQVLPPTEFHLGSVSSSTATAASSMSTAVAADSTDPSKRDFSNPMYEAMGDMESQVMSQADTDGLLKNGQVLRNTDT